ncbi:hypothetical protein PFISCL1PPCAC_15282, partial [Pristionchus fissidentatus]
PSLRLFYLLPFLFLHFQSVSSFWGCGCMPPPPPPCFQPIQLPQLCLPQIPLCPPPSCCGRKKRETVGLGTITSTRRPIISSLNSTITDSKCNSIPLKAIIDANLSSPSSISPQLSIHSALKAKFRGEWIVFCIEKTSGGSKSTFVADQTTFCASSNDKITCYAFQI